jgi:nucleotide-binding universal stress UspA family protein
MKTILAAIDFSPVSRRVVAEGASLAAALDARLVLFHSVPPSPLVAVELAHMVGPVVQFTDDVQKAAGRHLRRFARSLAGNDITVDAVVTSGYPVIEILGHVGKIGADYIVLGSHGHTAFYDLVAGSIASGVLKRASCPVIVVPALRKKARVRRRRQTREMNNV